MRNNSSHSTYNETLSRFGNKLIERGYSQKEVYDNFNKVNYHNRSDHIGKEPGSGDSECPLVFTTTFDPKWVHLGDVLHKHWDIIDNSLKLRDIFPKPPMIAYRRGDNIGDIITSTKLPV